MVGDYVCLIPFSPGLLTGTENLQGVASHNSSPTALCSICSTPCRRIFLAITFILLYDLPAVFRGRETRKLSGR